jgi:putative intracellular protease/amidase
MDDRSSVALRDPSKQKRSSADACAVVLYVGFDPLDVIAPYEVLHAAGMATGGAVTSNW